MKINKILSNLIQKVACRIRPLTEDEIMQGSSMIAHKVADDNMIVLMDPSEDADDILRANRSRERQFIFNMVFDAKSTQVNKKQQIFYFKKLKRWLVLIKFCDKLI